MSSIGSRGVSLRTIALAGASILALCVTGNVARAQTVFNFDIPQQPLSEALRAYARVAGDQIIFNDDLTRGRTATLHGTYTPDEALAKILKGSRLSAERLTANEVMVGPMPEPPPIKLTRVAAEIMPVHAAAAAGIESVVVTSSKIKGDIQTVPIAITALSQEQLTARQIAGGPDLVKEVPNLTFSKTNFTGYNIQIRGIGTQAISVTTDPAVAVAFNDTPFIRNHFFEQEFFDVSQVEVLRGPQGTLYGRNATAGVVNVVSAKPTDQFEAALSADLGNYHNRRYEGMINIPVVDDRLDIRVAGEWTKRDGYSFNETTNAPIDGRDLWSSRVSIGWKPSSDVQAYLIWEHFQENDDRLRSGKQLCKNDPGPATFTAYDGSIVQVPPAQGLPFEVTNAFFSQGCLPASLYSKDSFEVPNGFSLPFVSGAAFEGLVNTMIDPYAQTTQSTNLRDIQSAINPIYRAKNDTVEFNASWTITPTLTFSSDSGYNNDFLWSTEDYNRFDTSPGIFIYPRDPGDLNGAILPDPNSAGGIFCDPQLGCSDRLVVQDLSSEHAWQLSQEFRLASNFSGPFNFSIGGNYLHYETLENYYVFSNTFTMISLNNVGCDAVYVPNVTTNLYCLYNGKSYSDPTQGGGVGTESPQYVDPNPLTALNNEGHNYFLSKNPYVLNSYAGFGEAYFDVTKDLKLTAGLRWTDDEKHVIDFPSELVTFGYGYPSTGTVDQKWNQWTGRFVANWTPKLDFTDQSMFYGSYAHGYKAGGANPPGAVLISADVAAAENIEFPVHPLTFKPEFIDAYELGTKNTLLDGGLTLNGDIFFYNYKGYQISEIVDRTSVNLNFDATVRGAEIEATYEPLPGLKFSFAGGYEDTDIKKNQYAIDLMDRTAGTPGWVVMKPSIGQSSNCIFPEYVAAALTLIYNHNSEDTFGTSSCGVAYAGGLDPATTVPYDPNTTTVSSGGFTYPYPGFDPLSVDPSLTPSQLAAVNNGLGLPPNNGEGFAKNVGGNSLPNAPHYTASLTGDYTMPISADWAATLHADFYWQSQSWARVFNDRPYDKIRGYSNVNTALILTDASGWQVMGYVKNIFNTTAITGDFLNSDDSGLTTNIFLTDPRLYGVRITKHFDDGGSDGYDLLSSSDGKRPQIWLTLGGNYNALLNAGGEPWVPVNQPEFPDGLATPAQLQKPPKSGLDWQGLISYQPQDSDWVLAAGIRYGRASYNKSLHKSLAPVTKTTFRAFGPPVHCTAIDSGAPDPKCSIAAYDRFIDSKDASSEQHTILDFTLGKDVGIGAFGNGHSVISAGVRVAQFASKSGLTLGADVINHFVPTIFQKYHIVNEFDSQEKRNFHGIGPELHWDAVHSILGNADAGELSLDWGINAGVLFGRQSVKMNHQTSACRHNNLFNGTLNPCTSITTHSYSASRSRNATVPNLGGYAGLSVNYSNAKVSFGYRADEFFGAMDGGQATAKNYNRGFYGPYLNLSIGLGG